MVREGVMGESGNVREGSKVPVDLIDCRSSLRVGCREVRPTFIIKSEEVLRYDWIYY